MPAIWGGEKALGRGGKQLNFVWFSPPTNWGKMSMLTNIFQKLSHEKKIRVTFHYTGWVHRDPEIMVYEIIPI